MMLLFLWGFFYAENKLDYGGKGKSPFIQMSPYKFLKALLKRSGFSVLFRNTNNCLNCRSCMKSTSNMLSLYLIYNYVKSVHYVLRSILFFFFIRPSCQIAVNHLFIPPYILQNYLRINLKSLKKTEGLVQLSPLIDLFSI